MSANLVIVESPAKAKTIEKFLGKEYKVLSSFGHIRDLKKKDFGIDIAHNFTPHYEIPADKKKVVEALRKEAAQAQTVWLASDEDREGEAIAWHLAEVLGLDKTKTKRIVFHEITKQAILDAITTPRSIDLDMVNAQQARRVLDRIVGFELSPVLWKRVKPSLSAGRVQSVSVRLIVEREREVNAFVPEASYRVVATFLLEGGGEMKAELNTRFSTKGEAEAFLRHCQRATFTIEDITVRPAKKSPAAPFTTSTLQQEAARKLGFSVSQTMMVAQKLYEAGHITYMRTDSTNLSGLAINTCKEEIALHMGEQYIKVRNYQTKTKGAQEAHEAIRPTYMSKPVVSGTAQERKLYELIWKRTIASQMSDAELEKTTATIAVSNQAARFVAQGEVLIFDGFLRVYLESNDDDTEGDGDSRMLPPLAVGQPLHSNLITATERYTQRPPRYTEASLVRKLEELGIGRPSTYAPTISTIQQRDYVVKGDRAGDERNYNQLTLRDKTLTDETLTELTGSDKGRLLPTDIGIVVTDFLTTYFPSILDYNFTANIEEEFDLIAEGKKEWFAIIDAFYTQFHPSVETASAKRTEQKVGERLLGIDPKSGKPVSVKIGRYGPVVQLGSTEEEEKPQFASLQKGQSLMDITLEEAMELFRLPRTVGEYEDKKVVAAIGRFGAYLSHNSKFVSLPKQIDPLDVTLSQAIELIEAKRKAESEKLIRRFEHTPIIELLNGRYGPYLASDKKNYKLPKGTDIDTLTLEDAVAIIAKTDSQEGAPKAKAKRFARKSKK